jgi:tetratricopeptide (TPR) repeat protein
MRRYEMSVRALADADRTRSRGDLTAALRILDKALEQDPGNPKLIALRTVIARQAETEAQRGRILDLLEDARRGLAEGELGSVDRLLAEVESVDPSNLDADKLRRELTKAREQEERRSALGAIQAKVDELLRGESFGEAAELLNRAIDEFPNETTLHLLKAEVDAEASRLKAKRFVDAAISRARELFASSPLDALASLQMALDEMPGEERLVSYDLSLRDQIDVLRLEQVHGDTLRKAQEWMTGKRFDKAIGVLESFQLEFGHQKDVDDLLVFAKDELANQQRCAIIERCAAEGRASIRDGRLEEASCLLEHGIQETGDASLSRLLEEVREQQAALARKSEALQKRVAVLRDRGELDEAFQLLQEQLASTPRNVPLQELLVALRAEQEQKQVTANAIASARAAAQNKDFVAGFEALEAVLRAYGESAALAGTRQELESERSGYAQEVVEESIKLARTALLKNDPKGALAALQGATQMMEFADAKKQTDWQRIRQSVKEALEQPRTTGSHTLFDEQLSEITPAKPRRFPVWGFSVAGLALVAIAIAVIRPGAPSKPQESPAPHETKIRIAKAQPGSTVRVDNGPPQLVGDSGEVMIPVQPGIHRVMVSQAGFDDFLDTVSVESASTVQENVSLVASLPAGAATGTLSPLPQPALTKIRVFVDGELLGEKRAGEKIILKVGPHTVKYAWPGYQDSKDHRIRIAKDANVQDKFELVLFVPPPPTTGRFTIHTTGGAHISFDGQLSGTADSSGSYIIEDLKPGQHTVNISLDQYQVTSKQVMIAAGQSLSLDMPLQPIPPTGSLTVSSNLVERGKSVQLTWDVRNAKTVSISNYGDGLGVHGNFPVSPETTTTYELTANGIHLDAQTVNVIEPLKPPFVESKTAEPTLPDQATLEAALNPYKKVFAEAAGKNCKDTFSGNYQGRLRQWVIDCDTTKSFEVTEKSCQVGGSPEAPTLTCEETILIHPKDGPLHRVPNPRTFRFVKTSNGGWQIAGW